ncbi:MAG: tyrosine-type recombinase/integrase [Phycisphaerales bacterium]|nr:tyrosine-type recombinase/integrase [Phycisphaerales bacterium]
MSKLQAAVDRHIAGEPPDRETMKRLPRRLFESVGLVSELSAKRRGTYAENVKDYIDELKTLGRNAKYVRNVEMYLDAVGKACGWDRLTNVGRIAFSKYLQDRKDSGTAPRTLNNITTTVKTFCTWAVDGQRLDANPLEYVKRLDQTSDARRRRRALTQNEVSRLLAISGPRELVYRLALGTGLRRRELQRLQWRDVEIDEPTVHVSCSVPKRPKPSEPTPCRSRIRLPHGCERSVPRTTPPPMACSGPCRHSIHGVGT